MGRLNKKLQKSRANITTARNHGGRISTSDVLKTLARKDKLKADQYSPRSENPLNVAQNPTLPKTLDELDTHPDFQLLLLDKSTALQQLAQDSGLINNKLNQKVSNEKGSINKIKKKDKMKMRKELLQKKVHVIKLLKEEEKSVKKRKRTVVTGDMKPMADTINQVLVDEIEPLEEQKLKEIKLNTARKPKGTLKQKRVKTSFMEGLSVFNQVRSHPQYLKDPFGTISTHIENKMRMEAKTTE